MISARTTLSDTDEDYEAAQPRMHIDKENGLAWTEVAIGAG
jgi:hypothetical protein